MTHDVNVPQIMIGSTYQKDTGCGVNCRRWGWVSGGVMIMNFHNHNKTHFTPLLNCPTPSMTSHD